MSEYQKIRDELISRRDELALRLGRVKNNLSKTLNKDFSEQAVELENSEVLQAIGSEAETEINKINHALVRMDEGTYGTCETCGTDIPVERLQVRPYSSHCVRCAEAAEQARK